MLQGEAVFVDSAAWIALDSVLAVAVSALLAAERDRDALVLVVAADQVLRKPDEFREACQRAAAVAAEGRIVTFAIEPTHPGVAEKVGEFRL
jgi:mannose-1-phosphate guanylyltransferase / mannose-6-phosphate isomerase